MGFSSTSLKLIFSGEAPSSSSSSLNESVSSSFYSGTNFTFLVPPCPSKSFSSLDDKKASLPKSLSSTLTPPLLYSGDYAGLLFFCSSSCSSSVNEELELELELEDDEEETLAI